LESLKMPPVIWVGHSMGARTAAAGAFLRPDLVRALVLVDLGFSGPAGGGLGETLAQFLQVIPESYASRAEAREHLMTTCPDPSIGRYLLAVLQADPQPEAPGTVRFPFDRDALLATIDAATETEFRSKVRALASQGVPILALRGETSTVWSHADFEAERASFADLPNVVFEEWAGTGHGLPFEKRDAFIRRLAVLADSTG
jgi:pimeloyl-ACP methyl ester carboxylesterase